MGYLLPFGRSIELGQPYGSNPWVGPNPGGGHNGDDWLTVIGTPVRAAGDGEVVFAGQFDNTYADNFGWNLNFGGNMVVLNMDGETAPYFEYGHLSKILVSNGQRVKRGQIIALTGNSDGGTGVSTGPHCHVGCLPYNFNLNTNTYGRVNPRLYMTDYWEDTAGASVGPAGSIAETTEEDDMFTDDDRKLLKSVKQAIFDGGSSMPEGKPLKDLINDSFTSVRAQLATIGGTLTTTPGGDVQADAAAIAKALAPDLAKALLVELSKGGQ